MHSSNKLPRGIRRLFRLPSTYDRRMQDLDEEIRFHIDAEIEKLRRSGMSEIEARSAAEARFGDSADLRAYCGVIAAKRWSRQRLRGLYEELMQDCQSALRTVIDGIRAIPGVRGVTYGTKGPPGFAIGLFQLSVDGQSSMLDSVKTFDVNSVWSNYFAVTGIPLLQGRTFSPGASFDSDEIIINESLARRIWPNGDALGARLQHGDGRPPTDRPRTSNWWKVIGIVGDIRLPGSRGDSRAGQDFQIYLPEDRGPSFTTLVLRSGLAPAALAKAVDKVIRNVSSGIRVSSPLRTADEMLSARANGQRVVLKLIGVFAVLAMLLAAVGLHAVIAYSVGQRVREIGVRIALGATAADVAQLVLRQALGLALAGAVIGSIIAIASMRLLRSLLYGVTTTDPLTLAAVAVGLLIVAAVATFAPARRAAGLDPIAALRAD